MGLGVCDAASEEECFGNMINFTIIRDSFLFFVFFFRFVVRCVRVAVMHEENR